MFSESAVKRYSAAFHEEKKRVCYLPSADRRYFTCTRSVQSALLYRLRRTASKI
jgi:hypothetical protein